MNMEWKWNGWGMEMEWIEYGNGMAHSDTHDAKDGDAVTDLTAVVTMFGPWEAASLLHILRFNLCVIESNFL